MRPDEQVQIRHNITSGETVWVPMTMEEARTLLRLLRKAVAGEGPQRDLINTVSRRMSQRLDLTRLPDLHGHGMVVLTDPQRHGIHDLIGSWHDTKIGDLPLWDQ